MLTGKSHTAVNSLVILSNYQVNNMSSNMSLQPVDRCTYQGWGQRKLKSVAISAGTMPRNKPHSCFRIALSRQLSRDDRSPRLNVSMWLKEGREAINVAVPAGFLK